MKIIGITGGVATGKTTVAKILSSLLGAQVIDADEIVHGLVAPGEKVWEKIVKSFGKDILKRDSSIDKKKLAGEIFSNISERKKLEGIIHPEVKKIIKDKLKQLKKTNKKWVVMDIPLLFEAKMEHMIDKIIVVVRNENVQLDTLQREKSLSLEEAKERIGSQLPLSEKIKRAHFVVDNNGTFQNTEKQVKGICTCLKASKFE